MRIVEILLPKSVSDRSLSKQYINRIDVLQKRMDKYVDAIMNPKTTPNGREFLKSRLKDDLYDLRGLLKPLQRIDTLAETHPNQQLSIYNPNGTTYRNEYMPVLNPDPIDNAEPLSSIEDQSYDQDFDKEKIKRIVSSQLDKLSPRCRQILKMKFWSDMTDHEIAQRLNLSNARVSQIIRRSLYHLSRNSTGLRNLREAVHSLPLSDDDFELLKKMMDKPIPAVIAQIYIHDIIDDDEFNDQIAELAEKDPRMDIRPFIVEWIKKVMPDQMHRFGQEVGDEKLRKGILSPIHGYGLSSSNKGTDTGTQSSGNAYGRR